MAKDTYTSIGLKIDAETKANLDALQAELSAERGERVGITAAIRHALRVALQARNGAENKSGKSKKSS